MQLGFYLVMVLEDTENSLRNTGVLGIDDDRDGFWVISLKDP